mmetsp:Transcript_850/g.2406  ORF Transcript_850/g.2406 Transcript_850/m.2406 type:complete len:283 (-) Transcript_850:77-925(-)
MAVPGMDCLDEMMAELRERNRGVMYAVTNSSSTAFSPANLASYLRKRGVEVQEGVSREAIVTNAERLVALLEQTEAVPRRSGFLRHELVQGGVNLDLLTALLPSMVEAYVPQPLDYGENSRYADKWRISCYLQVKEDWKPHVDAHEPMWLCMGVVLEQCVNAFVSWHCSRHNLSSEEAIVMNSFVTRYRPMPEEDQLKKHIDGANVHGSFILALPTDDEFNGGTLHVWDDKPEQEFVYSMQPGDLLFLERAVWHQATAITSGTRWALVAFLELRHAVPRKPQ